MSDPSTILRIAQECLQEKQDELFWARSMRGRRGEQDGLHEVQYEASYDNDDDEEYGDVEDGKDEDDDDKKQIQAEADYDMERDDDYNDEVDDMYGNNECTTVY